MNMIKRKFFTATLAVLALGVLSAPAASPTPVLTNSNPNDAMTSLFGDPVIAKGKGFEIKQSALTQIMVGAKGQAAAAGQPLPPDFEGRALNRLIAIQMLLQTATDADKAEGQKAADLQYTNLLKHFGSLEAFNRQLEAVGMTMDDLRAKSLQEAVAEAALKRSMNVAITDAEVKNFYTNHPSDFEEPEKVHVRHLLIMTIDPATKEPLSDTQIAAKRKTIDGLLARVRAGEDFAALTKQYSEDPGLKDNEGEYTFSHGQMVPEFEAAAFALTNNQVSEVVKSSFGFHIIKLLDRTPARTLDLTTVNEGVTVADSIKNFLSQQKVAKGTPDYLTKLKTTADIQILDANLKAECAAADVAAAAAAAAAAADAPPAGQP
jgi:peptidyl-prolyl cis-trans isomerase C